MAGFQALAQRKPASCGTDGSAARENLLDPGFDHLAVGAAADASGRIVFAEVFRTTIAG